MVLFMLLHGVGLGGAIIMSLLYGAWDLVVVNGLVFLVLLWLERGLVGKRYTVPLAVYTDGKVGTAAVEEPCEAVSQPKAEELVQPEEVVPESMVTSDIGVAVVA